MSCLVLFVAGVVGVPVRVVDAGGQGATMNSTTPAIDRALHEIDELLSGKFITDIMAQRARDTVGLLFDSDTVYASIAPVDGDDVSFYWKAGDRSVSIDLYAEGGDWASVVDGARHRWTYSDHGVRPEVREHLRQFSSAVQTLNPNWREMTR